MILGKLRSQPKKILIKARTIKELADLLENVSTVDLNTRYKLDLSRENALKAIFAGLRNEKYFSFAYGLNDDEFDLNRFPLWDNFRNKNPTVANSKEYFQVKYGATWKKHVAAYKTDRANMYDPNHWISKGLSLEDAIARVNKIKRECSMPLERWIELYGEEEGRQRSAFQHRFHRNYDEIWNGNLKAKKQYTKEANRNSIEFWIKRGHSLEDAKIQVSLVQKKYSGLHQEYWLSHGYTGEQVKEIFDLINSKKDGSSLAFFIGKYGEVDGTKKYLDNCLVKSSCWRDHGKLAEKLYPGIKGYVTAVTRHTRKSKNKLGSCPGKQGKLKGNYHVDHIFSIVEGFKQNIPAEHIGHYKNLRWLLAEKNCSKRGLCDITYEELLRQINEN